MPEEIEEPEKTTEDPIQPLDLKEIINETIEAID